ncbi:MAG: S-layer homology domain-containing protein, partial [Patescibacteria group bacterium]
IEGLSDEGIFEGYPDGSFGVNDDINRAELTKILVEGQGITPSAIEHKNCFPDVSTEWFAKYVCYAKAAGWLNGYPDGTFKPGDVINKVEALKIMFNAYGEDLEEGQAVGDLVFSDLENDAWYSIYVLTASEWGLLEEEPGEAFNPDFDRSRGEMAEELYRYLILLDLI